MDFVLGAVVSLAIVFLLSVFKRYMITKNTPVKVLVTQSKTFDLMLDNMIIIPRQKQQMDTQSTLFYKKNSTRILFTDKNAYWIKDNNVYCADVGESGEILEESAKPLDMMSMDKVQLNEMIFIVEKLTEGNDDHRSAGN